MRAALLSLAFASGAWAQAPEASLRPEMRAEMRAAPAEPIAVAEPMVPHAPVYLTAQASQDSPRPVFRPGPDVEVSASVDRPAARPGLAEAGPVASSLRPLLRPYENWAQLSIPDAQDPEPDAEPALPGPTGTHELTLRGGLFGGGTRVIQVPAFAGDGATAVLLSPVPELRPDGLEARVRAAATRATPARVTELGVRGQLCGSAGIFGEELPPITGRISGCGIAEPVRVREVDGIALSTPATINCNTALALQDWLGRGARDCWRHGRRLGADPRGGVLFLPDAQQPAGRAAL